MKLADNYEDNTANPVHHDHPGKSEEEVTRVSLTAKRNSTPGPGTPGSGTPGSDVAPPVVEAMCIERHGDEAGVQKVVVAEVVTGDIRNVHPSFTPCCGVCCFICEARDECCPSHCEMEVMGFLCSCNSCPGEACLDRCALAECGCRTGCKPLYECTTRTCLGLMCLNKDGYCCCVAPVCEKLKCNTCFYSCGCNWCCPCLKCCCVKPPPRPPRPPCCKCPQISCTACIIGLCACAIKPCLNDKGHCRLCSCRNEKGKCDPTACTCCGQEEKHCSPSGCLCKQCINAETGQCRCCSCCATSGKAGSPCTIDAICPCCAVSGEKGKCDAHAICPCCVGSFGHVECNAHGCCSCERRGEHMGCRCWPKSGCWKIECEPCTAPCSSCGEIEGDCGSIGIMCGAPCHMSHVPCILNVCGFNICLDFTTIFGCQETLGELRHKLDDKHR